MSFRRGTTRTGEHWAATGTLHERLAAPAYDEERSAIAQQRATDNAIEQALAKSPTHVTADGLIVEQSADGGYVMSTHGSMRHRLARIEAEEAQRIAEAKARLKLA